MLEQTRRSCYFLFSLFAMLLTQVLHISCVDININFAIQVLSYFISILSEVPWTFQVNLQPAEHLLFWKQFSKMCPSAVRISGPPCPDGGGGKCQTCTKTFLEQMGMWVQNFIKIGAAVWISISPSHTNRQTDNQTFVNSIWYIYRLARSGAAKPPPFLPFLSYFSIFYCISPFFIVLCLFLPCPIPIPASVKGQTLRFYIY